MKNAKLPYLILNILVLVITSCGKNESTKTVPVLNTPSGSDIDSITATTAIVYASVNTDGDEPITAKGVCWSTAHNPTIADNKTINRVAQTQTTNGSGSVSFKAVITGLNPNTTYYLRVYATNSLGTGYSNEFSVTTINNTITTVTDIDENVYNTVQIGTQIWMRENLKTTHYNDGTPIPNITNDSIWGTEATGAYCYYNNDINNNSTYGKLYNWYATHTGKLAPVGWHVPTYAEFQTLITYLGGNTVAGGKMKTTTLWDSPNTGATNSSGFSALPAGFRVWQGTGFESFYDIGMSGVFGTSTEYSSNLTYIYNTLHASAEGYWDYNGKNIGVSIRCIKD